MSIYVWGTGCSAGELFQKGLSIECIKAFVDSHPMNTHFLGKPVLTPSNLPVENVELLLIASRHTQSIKKQCISMGLSEDVLFFTRNTYQLEDLNSHCSSAKKLLGSDLLEALKEPCQIIREPRMPHATALSSHDRAQDFVRIKTLELLTDSLLNVPGALAELGVFQGDFARLLNLLLPNRKLYLFDSFQGFDTVEAARELDAKNCDIPFIKAHENTSSASVLSKMPYLSQIILKEGYFSESARDLDEHFALVSLDADFEETTYAGLSWFWPRLSPGGYLLLHDYNSPNLVGVKRALLRYEKDHHLHLPGVPLCDINGTFILCKP